MSLSRRSFIASTAAVAAGPPIALAGGDGPEQHVTPLNIAAYSVGLFAEDCGTPYTREGNARVLRFMDVAINAGCGDLPLYDAAERIECVPLIAYLNLFTKQAWTDRADTESEVREVLSAAEARRAAGKTAEEMIALRHSGLRGDYARFHPDGDLHYWDATDAAVQCVADLSAGLPFTGSLRDARERYSSLSDRYVAYVAEECHPREAETELWQDTGKGMRLIVHSLLHALVGDDDDDRIEEVGDRRRELAEPVRVMLGCADVDGRRAGA